MKASPNELLYRGIKIGDDHNPGHAKLNYPSIERGFNSFPKMSLPLSAAPACLFKISTYSERYLAKTGDNLSCKVFKTWPLNFIV